MLIVFTARIWDVFIRKRKWLKVIFIIFLVLSIYVHFLGAEYYQCGFNFAPDNIDFNTTRRWDYKDGEISRCSAKFWKDVSSAITAPPNKQFGFNNWSMRLHFD
jgi:hypothetical protein